MEDSPQNQKTKKPAKSYGGRSKKQWIIIYLIVAIVVYFIIYWIWIRDTSGSSSGGLY